MNIAIWRCVLLLLLSVPLAGKAQTQAQPTLADTICERFLQMLLPQEKTACDDAARRAQQRLEDLLREHEPGFSNSDRVVVELQQRAPLNASRIARYLSEQDSTGRWTDINYQDKKRSGWEPRLHAERMYELVRALLTPGTPYYKAPAVERAIHRALNYWLTRRPAPLNWWYDEIGVPRTLGTALVLFDARLTDEERRQAADYMKVAKIGRTGQNRVWLAGNVMLRAIIARDDSLLRVARNVIAAEIRTDATEGIRPDWCFHQHGTQQQFGNYGLAYICAMSRDMGLFADTSLQFSPQQTDILLNLLNAGYRWVVWHGEMDINALGRQFFRDAPFHKALSLGFAALEMGQDGWVAECFGMDSIRSGHNHFFCSDYTLSRRPTWMASLKMSSARVIGAESLNGDNVSGYYGGDGALFIYRDGARYRNIFPLWQWRRLPGVTAYAHPGAAMPLPTGRNNNAATFVGGLSDGRHGMSVMRLERDGLQADKCWLFLDSVVVCLGAGIASDSALEVTTAVEQCRLMGRTERHDTRRDVRLWHHGMGYVVPKGDGSSPCRVEQERATGSWHRVMQLYADSAVTDSLLSVTIHHGAAPREAAYLFYLLPDISAKALRRWDAGEVSVLRNDRRMQALSHHNVTWVAAKEADSLRLPAKGRRRTTVAFLTPGIYRIEQADGAICRITACDPTQQQTTLALSIDGRRLSIALPQGQAKGSAAEIVVE